MQLLILSLAVCRIKSHNRKFPARLCGQCAISDPIVEAMKRLNLGDVSRVVQKMLLNRNSGPNQPHQRVKNEQEGYTRGCKGTTDRSSRTRCEMFGQKGGAQKSQNQRDARVVLLESQGVRPQRKMPVLNDRKGQAKRG